MPTMFVFSLTLTLEKGAGLQLATRSGGMVNTRAAVQFCVTGDVGAGQLKSMARTLLACMLWARVRYYRFSLCLSVVCLGVCV